MNKLKRFITSSTILCILSANAYAESVSDMSNPDSLVNVIKSANGQQTTVYSGNLDGYNNGMFEDLDYFIELDYTVIFNQSGTENEALYIIPSTSQTTQFNNVINTTSTIDTIQLNNTISPVSLQTNISLMYNDEYHEGIILPGETLTLPVTVTNTGTSTTEINSYIAKYNLSGKLTDIVQGNLITVPGNQTVTTSISNEFNTDTACTAKIFFWQKDNLNPVTNDIYLTVQGQDYYADSYTAANKIDVDKKFCGVINTNTDIDIVKFTPPTTGIYALQLDASNGTVCGLYDSSQTLLNSISAIEDKSYLLYSLTANQDYYIKFNGIENNSYEITPALPGEITTLAKNIGTASNLSNNSDFNVYRFIPSTTGSYIITAVDSLNVKADLYNSSFEKIMSSDMSDSTVSFRITSDMVENHEYYVVVYPKAENALGSYTMYVEEPFALVSIE